MVNESPVRIGPAEAAIRPPAADRPPAGRGLHQREHTRRAYAGALRRLVAWLGREFRRRADGPGARRLPAIRRPAIAAAARRDRSGVSDLATVLATCHQPRRRGRGVESDQVALKRWPSRCGDRRICSSWAGMRRCEVSARCTGPTSSDRLTATAMLVTVRRSKTNPEGSSRPQPKRPASPPAQPRSVVLLHGTYRTAS